MKLGIPKRTVRANLVVIDSVFPQQDPYAFRNAEINEYIKRIKGFRAYSMYPMRPENAPFAHNYGTTSKQFKINKVGYLRHHPENRSALYYLNSKKHYGFKLAYSFFLAETFALLPFYEKNKIPFVFVLYPGGLFGIDAEASDSMLRSLFNSPFFKGAIVTQTITKKYLLQKKFCRPEQIHYIYGGFVQFKPDEILAKKEYKRDKDTFDICFVAAKYSEQGVDKGYDVFVKTAKLLASKRDDIRFHVVGGFDDTDIDVAELGEKITFYGFKRPDFLLKFYSSMDILLSPNRPHKLYEGNFDGFPLGIDAGYCGTALFVTDQLNMNEHYVNGKDIEIINLKPSVISATILKYYDEPAKLHVLGRNCQTTTQRLFDVDAQINSRLKVFDKYIKLEARESIVRKQS